MCRGCWQSGGEAVPGGEAGFVPHHAGLVGLAGGVAPPLCPGAGQGASRWRCRCRALPSPVGNEIGFATKRQSIAGYRISINHAPRHHAPRGVSAAAGSDITTGGAEAGLPPRRAPVP